ncbi:lipopolysaccharide biosynthesis protein [Marinomonas ostreistagni]|uniref:lipopolysaccharide biosynthesis protein n=1 Tax=Marinomonas ostreistagni TaxID=359209 RepID=UPI0019524E2C|nr:oligosaccharide flippase family protein [Marinomonas ostreistagni]MBM6551060.1 oligosaccharide flippase family protein [Marinomonas ostreistagni]
MKEKIKYLTLSYGTAALQFLLLPPFVSALGKNGYGQYSYYLSIITWFCFFSTLGSPTKIRKIAAAIIYSDADYLNYKKKISAAVFFVSILSSFSCLVFYSLFDSFIGSVYIVLYSIFIIYSSYLISNDKVIYSAFFSLLITVLPIASVIFLDALFINAEWSLRFFASSILIFFIFISFDKVFFDFFKFSNLNASDLVETAKENFKLAPNGIYDKIVSQGDKVYVGAFFGVETLAIYALGAQLSNILYITMKAFTVYMETKIYRKKIKIMEVCMLFGGALPFVFVLYYIISKLFPFLFSDEFYDVISILIFQLMVVLFRVFSNVLFSYDYASEYSFSVLRNMFVQYFFLFTFCILLFFNGVDTIYQFSFYLMIFCSFGVLVNFCFCFYRERMR